MFQNKCIAGEEVMPTTIKKRPYGFNRLLTSLSAQGVYRSADWERSLSDQTAKFYQQHSIQQKQENADFIPTRQMVRDLLTGTASSGGDLVATTVQKVADSVRPVTVLEKAGVERIETGGENLTIPRFAKADAGWTAENVDYTALTTTSTSVDATPKLASARLSFSRRLKVLVPEVESAVLSEVGRAVAALIEKGAIQGTGSSNQPLGLLNLPGALSKTFAAATPTSSELVDMLELVADADVDPYKLVWVLHPSMAANLRRSEISAGSGELVLNFIGDTFRLHGVPVLMTTNIPEGKVLLFDPSYSRLVYFGAPQVVVDPYKAATTGATTVSVLNAMDLACSHPSSICIGSA